MTIKKLEDRFPPSVFVRTHRSFLVATQKITVIQRDIVCIGNKEIPLSESYKDDVLRLVHKL